MMNLYRLIFLLICLTLLWAPVLFFAQYNRVFSISFILSLIDLPSMFCVFFPSLIHLVLLHHPRKLVRAVGHIFSDGEENIESLQESLQIWSRWGVLLIGWGVAMTCSNIWQMIEVMSNSNKVISYLKVGCLAMQYGALFALLFTFLPHFVIEQRLLAAKRIHGEDSC